MSSIRDKFRKQREELLEKAKRGQENNTGQFIYASVFDSTKIPEGIGFFKPHEGQNIIDILPFVAGSQHPRTPEGEVTWVIDQWVHYDVGVNQEVYVCPTKNFGNKYPCPICQYIRAQRMDAEEWRNFPQRAKRRTIFLVWDRTTPEDEEKGAQIWDVSYYFIKRILDELQAQGDNGVIPYYDPDEGCHVVFTKRGKGRGNVEYLGHAFRARKAPIPDEILEMADFALDECIKMKPSYKEIYEDFYGEPYNEESKFRRAKPVEIEEEEDLPDIDDSKFETPTPITPDSVSYNEEKEVKEKSLKCPQANGVFGEDYNTMRACRTCEIWEECEEKFDEITNNTSEDTKAPTNTAPPKAPPQEEQPTTPPTTRRRRVRRTRR